MHSIDKPNMDNIEEHLEQCISKLRSCKEKTLSLVPNIISNSITYEEKAQSNQLYSLEPLTLDNDLTENKIFSKLYKNQMVNTRGYANSLYNKLKSAAPFGKCPYCSQQDVQEIDHFLPKTNSGFPELSIIPINLVPICSRCNLKKHEFIPSEPTSQFIHPYYIDAIDTFRWLYAKIDFAIDNEPTFIFYINCPDETETDIVANINFQFEKLQLGELYSKNAANEYWGRKKSIINTSLSINILKKMLLEQAQSYEDYRINSWEAAMYYALHENIDAIINQVNQHA